jgi:hypothetical protein
MRLISSSYWIANLWTSPIKATPPPSSLHTQGLTAACNWLTVRPSTATRRCVRIRHLAHFRDQADHDLGYLTPLTATTAHPNQTLPEFDNILGEADLTSELFADLTIKFQIRSVEHCISQESESLMRRLSYAALLLFGTVVASNLLGALLYNSNAVQEWRYWWPLTGVVYVAQAYQNLSEKDFGGKSVPLLPFPIISVWANILAGLCGIGLVVGGAYDAFMPVWMMGPNVVTEAGIGQDSAVALMLLTAYSVLNCTTSARSFKDTDSGIHSWCSPHFPNSAQLLAQIALLSQLYILGDGSINAILADVFSALPVN